MDNRRRAAQRSETSEIAKTSGKQTPLSLSSRAEKHHRMAPSNSDHATSRQPALRFVFTTAS
jgi:hypothetical protein